MMETGRSQWKSHFAFELWLSSQIFGSKVVRRSLSYVDEEEP